MADRTAPASPAPGAANPLRGRSRTLITRALEELRTAGDEEGVAAVTARYNAPAPPRTAVILGEVKRGKSMLANALVGRRGLLPVDVDLCTPVACAITCLEHGDPADAGGVVVTARRGTRVERIDPSRIPVHRHGRAAAADLPEAVEVRLAGTPLPGFRIVDTPGVGGLDGESVDYALSLARDAGVLLLVLDPATPITVPEMEILARATATAGAVHVVVAKTDKNLADWRTIVETDRRLIREHLGADLPVTGVSSLRALDAAELAPGPERDAVEVDSGIAELRDHLIRLHGAGRLVSNQVGFRLAAGRLREAARRQRARAATLDPDPRAAADLERDLVRLRELRRQGRHWLPEFSAEVNDCRRAANADLERRLAEIREKWEGSIRRRGARGLLRSPAVFTAHVEQDLTAAVDDAQAAFLVALEEVHARRTGDPAAWPAQRARLAEAAAERLAVEHPELTRGADGVLDPSLLLMTVTGSKILGGAAVAGLGTAGATVAAPVIVVAGAVWLGANLATRLRRRGDAEGRKWLGEALAGVRRTWAGQVDAVTDRFRVDVQIASQDRLQDRIDELAEDLRTRQAAANRDEAQRLRERDRARAAERRLSDLAADLEDHALVLAEGGGRR